MSKYIDGFVLVVPKDNLEAYKKMASQAAEIWKDHGALEYVEAVGDDMEIPSMPLSFPKLAGASESEVVVFSYITYESRSHRDVVNGKVMEDERMKAICPSAGNTGSMPFDPARMAYGGFQVLIEA